MNYILRGPILKILNPFSSRIMLTNFKVVSNSLIFAFSSVLAPNSKNLQCLSVEINTWADILHIFVLRTTFFSPELHTVGVFGLWSERECLCHEITYVKKLLLRPCSKCTENIQKELAIRNWKTKLESSEHRHQSFNLSQEEQFINVCAFSVFLPRFLVEFLYTSVAKKEPFAKMLSSARLR